MVSDSGIIQLKMYASGNLWQYCKSLAHDIVDSNHQSSKQKTTIIRESPNTLLVNSLLLGIKLLVLHGCVERWLLGVLLRSEPRAYSNHGHEFYFCLILLALYLDSLYEHIGVLQITAGWQIADINEICLDNKEMSASLLADFCEVM